MQIHGPPKILLDIEGVHPNLKAMLWWLKRLSRIDLSMDSTDHTANIYAAAPIHPRRFLPRLSPLASRLGSCRPAAAAASSVHKVRLQIWLYPFSISGIICIPSCLRSIHVIKLLEGRSLMIFFEHDAIL